MARVVVATDMSTKEETKFKSVSDAVKAGYTRQCIYDVLKGKQAFHKGMLWRYAYEGFKKDRLIGEKRYVENVAHNSSGE